MKSNIVLQTIRAWRAMGCGLGLTIVFTFSSSAAVAPTGTLRSARYVHAAAALPNGNVLVVGGQGTNGALASAEIYDATAGTWTNAGSLFHPSRVPTATPLLNGSVLVAGGVNDNGPLAHSQLYDPASGTWSSTGPLQTARFWHTATLLPNGRVLVAGGQGPAGTLASAEVYDPVTRTWTATSAMITPRRSHTATLLSNGQVLLAAGFNDAGLTARTELFNPATGTWTATTAMRTARNTHTASLLPDGKVLATGGWKNSYRASVEIYDPVTGLWESSVVLNSPRGYHTATVLPDGNVLLAAGQDDSLALATAEVYHRSGTTWPAPITLTAMRAEHTETLLTNGTVLLTGGRDANYNPLASVEICDPTGTIFVPNTALTLALDAPALTWIAGGEKAWFSQPATTHDGVDAAQSGSLPDEEESWLQTTVNGPGTLTFWWKVSSEANFDWLRFHIDGVLQQQISGEVNWQQRSFFIPSGRHDLRWRYVKDPSSPDGQDRAWLDQVSFTPAAGAPLIATQPRSEIAWPGAKVTLSAVALGAPPLALQWFFNSTNALPDATNDSLVLPALSPGEAGRYHLVASNPLGSVASTVVSVTMTNNAAVGQVLLFSDSLGFSPFELALTNLSQPYQRFSAESTFNAAVNAANRASTLVIVDAPQQIYAFSSLAGFVSGGGRVLIQAYSLAASPTLAATFQVAIESRSADPLPAHDWSGSPLWAGLPNPVGIGELFLLEDVQRLHPLTGALPVAGFTSVPASGQAAIVLGNGGRTIVNGFYAQGALPMNDAVRLAENEIGFLIGALGAPAIHTQPQDQFLAIGATATFGVVAVGARPLTYQWRKNAQPIPGATGTNHTIVGVQSNHFGAYDVVVNNAQGSVTSRVATLDLGLVPGIVRPPLSQSVVAGGSVTFSVEITGNPPPFTYEWRKLAAPRFTNVVASNERFSFFRVTNATAELAGNYAVTVRNPAFPSGVSAPIFNLSVLADTDGDGLPDAWESDYQLGDAGADADGDGLNNLEEYQAGTNPTNAASRLRIDGFTIGPPASIQFEASSNRTYAVQSSVELGGAWTRVAEVVARATNQTITIFDPAFTPQRYYRIVTPWQP